ncbi:MAG TPA: M20 family metallopeptidase [Candidatus Limnocylindria bacterium]|nr:M20 family metallopeptidase [Candidatus Limnocylindria bacterium]
MRAQDGIRRELIALSREIHGDPELAYKEERGVARIAALLRAHGHTVEMGIGGLATAFRARVGPSGKSVAMLAEYDALAGVGHGCGHNLIAMTNVGAFLLAAADPERLEVPVELIGTPAEEDGGGKIDLLRAGVFETVGYALSTHPAAQAAWVVSATGLGIVGKRVIYRGRSSHAGSSPERGRNALSGVIRLFTGIDGWRQQLPTDSRVHGIIDFGGDAVNVVPSRAEARFGLRARDLDTLREMEVAFTNVAQGAALETSTTVEISDYLPLYAPVAANATLGDAVAAELRARGVEPERGTLVTASTDLGNVSQRVPTDWIRFPVSEHAIPGHSDEMRDACVTDRAHANAIVTMEALGAAARRVATDGRLRASIAA